jgi:type I restriction enzyme R subunit
LIILVKIFLTLFDGITLNTHLVGKNLKSHSLMQAYSRTNRILNSVKTFGNIISLREINEEMDEA